MSDRASPTRPVKRHRATPANQRATWFGLRHRIRLIVLLPVAVTLLLLAAYSLRTTSELSAQVWPVWIAVMTGSVISASVAWRVGAAAVVEAQQERSAHDQQVAQFFARVRAVLPEALSDVRATVNQVRKGESPQTRRPHAAPVGEDPAAQLERDLGEFVGDVQRCVAESSASLEQAALLTISRRMQSLVNQVLAGFDRLEENIEDPEVLPLVFRLDHGVTRIRRLTDSFALVGGAVPRRSAQPLLLPAVIQHAISEVEHYRRVQQVTVIDDLVVGEATVRLVHLLAELIENATNFSSPDTPVVVRTERVPAGVVIEIDDRGKRMPDTTVQRLNRLLASDPRQLGGEFARDGRIGMRVVAEHAHKLGLTVRLQANIYGSNQALVLIPNRLLLPGDQSPEARAGGQPGTSTYPASAEVPDPGLTSATLQMAVARRPSAAAGTSPAPERGTAPSPPLPRRPPDLASFSPGSTHVPAVPAAGRHSQVPPLPTRDLSQSYLVPELQDRPQTPAPERKAADPWVFARFNAGREKASGTAQDTE
ncbi:ATP-binding protein [Streptomyces sp. NPDC002676]